MRVAFCAGGGSRAAITVVAVLSAGIHAPGARSAEPAAGPATLGACGPGVHAINPSACLGVVNTAVGALSVPAGGVAGRSALDGHWPLPHVLNEDVSVGGSLLLDAPDASSGRLPQAYEALLAVNGRLPATAGTGAPTDPLAAWGHAVRGLTPRLEERPAGSGLWLVGDDGQEILYPRDPHGTYRRLPGVRSSLEATDDGFELVRHDGIRYRFDETGRLLRCQDRNGVGYSVNYDPRGHPERITADAGEALVLFHDDEGRMTSLVADDGRRVELAYTGRLPVRIIDARGGTTSFAYDSEGRLTRVTDPTGTDVLELEYDADGRVSAVVDALNHRSTYAYDRGVTTATDPAGGVWTDTYDGVRLLQRRDPLGAQTSVERDGELNLTGTTDALGTATTMTYDRRGNLLTSTVAGSTHRFAYDEQNDLVAWTDPRGATTRFAYDAGGKLVRLEDRSGGVWTADRDLRTGLPLSVTDPLGHVTRFVYDERERLSGMTTALGSTTRYSYDAAGRLAAVIDPEGRTWTAAYDPAGNVVFARDAAGRATTYSYDPAGRLTTVRDTLGRTTSSAYDPAGRTAVLTRADGAELRYAYDAAGNLTRSIDALGHVTSLSYDPAGRPVSITTPAGRSWTVAYDPAGRIITATDPRGTTVSYGRDALGRPTDVRFADPATPGVRYSYDANGNRVSMGDGRGVTTYAYDASDRLITVREPFGEIAYEYDHAGRVTRRTTAGAVVTYAHDADGRLTDARSPGGTIRYRYDASGRLLAAAGPVAVEHRTWDGAGSLASVRTTLTSGIVLSFEYERDQAGRVIGMSTSDGATTYAYDSLDRLVRESSAARGATTYAYDAAGNRVRKTDAHGVTSYDHDADGRLLRELRPGPSVAARPTLVSYTNDAAGNRIARAEGGLVTRYAYDAASRLVALDPATGPGVDYAYSGDGLLVGRASGGTRTELLLEAVGPAPRAVDERRQHGSGAGTPSDLYRYLLGTDGRPEALTAARVTGAQLTYVRDGLGSIVAAADETGQVAHRYDYDAFGVQLARLSPADPNPLGHRSNRYEATDKLTYILEIDAAGAVAGGGWHDPATAQPLAGAPLFRSLTAGADGGALMRSPDGILHWQDDPVPGRAAFVPFGAGPRWSFRVPHGGQNKDVADWFKQAQTGPSRLPHLRRTWSFPWPP